MANRLFTISIYNDQDNNSSKHFSTIFFSNLILAIFLIIPIIILISNLDIFQISPYLLSNVTLLWTILFFNYLFNIVTYCFGISFFSSNKLYIGSIINIFASFIKFSITFLLFHYYDTKLWYVGIGLLISSLFTFVLNLYFSKKIYPKLHIKKRFFDLKILKSLLTSGFWNSVTRISMVFYTGLDLILVNFFISPYYMGVLSVAKILPSIILSFFFTIAATYSPRFTISYASKNEEQLKMDLFQSIKLIVFFSSIPLTILIFLGKGFYQLWLPEQESQILINITILILLELLFALPLESLWNLFTVKNKLKVTSLFMLFFSLISFAITILLLSLYNDLILRLYIIAGVSSLIGIIRSLTFLPLYGSYILKLKTFTFYPFLIKNLFVISILSMFSFIVTNLFLPYTWILLVFNALSISILGIALNYIFILNKKDRFKVLSIFFGLKKYLKSFL